VIAHWPPDPAPRHRTVSGCCRLGAAAMSRARHAVRRSRYAAVRQASEHYCRGWRTRKIGPNSAASMPLLVEAHVRLNRRFGSPRSISL